MDKISSISANFIDQFTRILGTFLPKEFILFLQKYWIFILFSLMILFVTTKLIREFIRFKQMPDQLDNLKREDYLKLLITVFQKLGYLVQPVGLLNSFYGADLIVEKQGKKTAVRLLSKISIVEVSEIDSAIKAKEFYKCSEGMVISSGKFSDEAIEQAKKKGIMLWDKKTLYKNLNAL
jgi:HJR/Mrr/RecB family endonuclease